MYDFTFLICILDSQCISARTGLLPGVASPRGLRRRTDRDGPHLNNWVHHNICDFVHSRVKSYLTITLIQRPRSGVNREEFPPADTQPANDKKVIFVTRFVTTHEI